MKKSIGVVAAVVCVGVAATVVSSLTAGADEPGGQDASPHVVDGGPAEEDRYPGMVALALAGSPDVNYCGGTLLTADVVLTAAHCIRNEEPSGIVIRHGSVDLESDDMIDVEIAELHVADDYGEPTSSAYDWGLVRLAEPIDDAQTVTLADNEEHDTGVFEVAGWGWIEYGEYPTVLQWAEVPHVDDELCAEAYDDLDLWHAESMLCAGYFDDGGPDACQGDSGGPLMHRTAADELIQVGIVSWGKDCGLPGQPGVYAQVSAFVDDVNDVVEELTQHP